MDSTILAALIGIGVLVILQLIAAAFWAGGISRGLKDLVKSFSKLPCQRDGADCPGEDCKKTLTEKGESR
jgi:hypothetical protein